MLDSILQLTSNLSYHCSIWSLRWLSSTAEQEWKVHNFDYRWWQILKHSWHSKCHYSKDLHWRVLTMCLPLGRTKDTWKSIVICFFFTLQVEDSTRHLIQYMRLVRFGVTFLRFGKFCHVAIWCQGSGCLHNSQNLNRTQRWRSFSSF